MWKLGKEISMVGGGMSGWMQEGKEAEVESREWHARHDILALILISVVRR